MYNFSIFSWVFMLFCVGVVIGIIYWGMIEWVYYMDILFFGLELGSNEVIEFVVIYGIFYWGIVGWVYYSLFVVVFVYVYYVKKILMFCISKVC